MVGVIVRIVAWSIIEAKIKLIHYGIIEKWLFVEERRFI